MLKPGTGWGCKQKMAKKSLRWDVNGSATRLSIFCMVLATKFLAKVTKKISFGLFWKRYFLSTYNCCGDFWAKFDSVNIDLYLQHRGPGRCRRPWREGQRPNGGRGLTDWGFEEASARRNSCTSASSSGTPYHPRSSSGSGSLKGTWNMSTWRSTRSKGWSSIGKYRTKYSEVEPSTGR